MIEVRRSPTNSAQSKDNEKIVKEKIRGEGHASSSVTYFTHLSLMLFSFLSLLGSDPEGLLSLTPIHNHAKQGTGIAEHILPVGDLSQSISSS